ncbi:MAG: ornithine carbamoyltransferase, partial [Deltaproteobacteria bacterium]|nr:ornithine carbamoyltransferase [Deltaproteobacteria bacterium]
MSKWDFLKLSDLTGAEMEEVFTRAARMKAERANGCQQSTLTGRTVGMIFSKPSTRTRVSFQVGVYELGGRVVYMQESETQMGRQEPLSHTGRVLSRYLDAIVIRTSDHSVVEGLAKYATIPVINALTTKSHPCQVLSDIFTVIEKKGSMNGLKVAWIGDGNNMAYSWIEAAGLMGFPLTLAVPECYDPDPEILAISRARTTAPIIVIREPLEAG